MFLASSILSGALCLCTVSVLLVSPATTSHSCFRGHKRREGENSLQTGIDVSDSASVIAGYKKELFDALTKLHRNAKQLKKHIERKHLTNQLKKECKHSPSLRGLPQIKAEKVPQEEWVEVLTDDFRRLAIANEFVSSAALDTNTYEQRLQNVSRDLQKCVCYLELLSNYNNLDLSHDITAAVVPRRYKNTTTQALSDRRNCIIVRDVLGLVSDMKKMYAVEKTAKKT